MPPDLQPQIQRMLDGELSAGELAALESELLENEESRAVYLKLATLHSDLEVLHSGQSTLVKANIVPIELIVARQRKRVLKVAICAAAAIVMISMVLMYLSQIPEQPIAIFRTTPSADFSLTHDLADGDAPVGQVLAVGSKLHLRKGILESKFESGVRVVIEAPCVLRVIEEGRVAVDQGVAWFEVPEKAVGFTVETPELTVIDLGTAFGVDSSSTGHDEVHVIRGAVKVTARVDGGKSETLREGEARRANDQGQLVAIKINAEHFTDTLPVNQGLNQGLIGHWEFDGGVYTEDSSGNGHTGKIDGAKINPKGKFGSGLESFAGYIMPIKYTSVKEEHNAVRSGVGVFDLSHMGEFRVKGKDASKFLDYLLTNDSEVELGKAYYSTMCYPDGGIVDDLIVYRLREDEYLIIVNASNIEKDWAWVKSTVPAA